MRFRPCIDIHNGSVKQIVGATLSENGAVSEAKNNFVSTSGADFYANLYKNQNLPGGHVIMLNAPGDEKYEDTKKEAQKALEAYPGSMQVGGSITDKNAQKWLDRGASHVIVTSFVFNEGRIDMDKLKALEAAVGADKIVLDLSACRVGDEYHVVTDRWQHTSDELVNMDLFEKLSAYCDQFLVHAADIEGKRRGIDENLVKLLGSWEGKVITYAGGISKKEDIVKIKDLSEGRLDFTVGSALDIFGGRISLKDIIKISD